MPRLGWTIRISARCSHLLDDKNVWVKVSGLDRATRQGPPYPMQCRLPESWWRNSVTAVVWGTDWPHPKPGPPVVDDGVLVDILNEIAPAQAALQALLVDNPQRFYHFAPARR